MNKPLSCRFNMDTNRVEARFNCRRSPTEYIKSLYETKCGSYVVFHNIAAVSSYWGVRCSCYTNPLTLLLHHAVS